MAASIKDMIDFEKDSAPSSDMVNHPPHYNQYGIECIDAIKACTGKGLKHIYKVIY